MLPGINTKIIKVSGKSNFSFKTGDIVTINVIKRLTGNKWAVGIKSKVYPVFTEFELEPGQKYEASVLRSKAKVFLKLIKSENSWFQDIINQIRVQGLPEDNLSVKIILSLIRTEQVVNIDTINKIRKYLINKKDNVSRLTRLLAIILNKQIDISNKNIEMLVEILQYGENKDNGKRRRYKKKDLPDKPEEIEDVIKKDIYRVHHGNENMLQVFNHLKGNKQSWIVLPYHYLLAGIDYSGTIRILYNNFINKVEKIIFIINQGENVKWSYLIKPEKTFYRLVIFCNSKDKISACLKKIRELRIKLQNIGVKIDDIIYNDDDFDGFTPDWEGAPYKRINTVL